MTEKFVRRDWDIDIDASELEGLSLEEAYAAGFWRCHNQTLNEIARLGLEMKRRRWPNMEAGVRKVLNFLVRGDVR